VILYKGRYWEACDHRADHPVTGTGLLPGIITQTHAMLTGV
jgi:hypothetical protein